MLLLLTTLLALLQSPASATSRAFIAVPSGQHVVLTAQGRGVQIYGCTAGQGASPQWALLAPRADLFVGNDHVGSHSAGPRWQYRDGSAVVGMLAGTLASARPDSIPQLLLTAKSAGGKGLFSQVSYVQRTQTEGGLAPRSGCDALHLHATAEIPYRAMYLFYSPD